MTERVAWGKYIVEFEAGEPTRNEARSPHDDFWKASTEVSEDQTWLNFDQMAFSIRIIRGPMIIHR